MLKLTDLALRPDVQVGPMLVSPSRRLVEGPGGHTHVEPLIMQVFLLLLDAAGKVVTRTELFDQCWGGVIVGDDSLNRAILKIRRTGAHVAPGLFEIETIPRTGYRLTGEIIGLMNGSAAQTRLETEVRGSGVNRRLLVGGGLAAMATAGAGSWLLLRQRTDAQAKELIGRADQILRFGLPGTKPEATKLLKQAVALEPDNARASGLLAYATASEWDDATLPAQSLEVTAAADQAIRRALALQSNEPNALLARYIIAGTLRDWISADEHLRAILEIDPENIFAMNRIVALTQAAGLNRESWKWNERALEMNPMAPTPNFRRALKFWINGNVPKADLTADRALDRWPQHPWVWNARFIIYAFSGRPWAALAMLDDVNSRPKDVPDDALSVWRKSLVALHERTPQTIAAAREANLAGASKATGLAAYGVLILSAIGDIDAAYAIANGFLLARGNIIPRRPSGGPNFVNGAGWRLTQWLFTPPAAPFRADPRFEPLCDALGLTGYWRKRQVVPDYRLARG